MKNSKSSLWSCSSTVRRFLPKYDPGLRVRAETFEGLGIGVRLAQLELPEEYRWYPLAGAVLFGLTTPVGIAAGLGVRSTYNPGTATASIVTGVMDSLSAGILIYTALVEVRPPVFIKDWYLLHI